MYGQTTSGKTYTMLGSESSPGVLPCAIRDIFKGIELVSNFKFNRHFQQEKTKQAYFNIWVSYLEIYNETINDLFNKDN